ncbi:Pectinesterase 3 [Camellia lanceoleosa]|uniref:Pectinesterase 3 n=1 Tax=Camellia lanceoleosa TaxID=1840588 RepID=A0ACC0F9F1_9ERIC|nr:Pectinesterase 3 [Camellia lanceoleosa]
MDNIKSFKGYGKVDPGEERAFKRKARKRFVIVIISSIVLVAVIIGAVVGTVIHNRNNDDSGNSPSSSTSPAASLKAVCSVTQYPESCFSSINALEASNSTTDPKELFKLSLQVVFHELSKIASFPDTLISQINDTQVQSALEVCKTVIDDAVYRLNDSISSMDANPGEKILTIPNIDGLKTWLSAAITDQETCFDALMEANSSLIDEVRLTMKNSTEFASNSLAIVAEVMAIMVDVNVPIHRKLLGVSDSGFPEWVGAAERRLLQAAAVKPNLVVAQDGSGNYKTIGEAVAMVPKKSKSRFVIYVKAGTYVENVNLDKNTWNVMMYGDGMNQTIVSGSLNVIDGTATFLSATFAVSGMGFIAKNMGFWNTAGAMKQQAVAVQSSSDLSVFYQCTFNAYQDTLYTHANRQFYSNCDIIGTIDFIFGNAAVVFQNCNIQPRQPLINQFDTITAQGKTDKNQNTGISIQKCFVSSFDNLTAATYLGRPWKNYSTTVVMETNIGSFLNPLGWVPWNGPADPPSTIFYAEYQNTGPGSNVTNRVQWTGYRSNITKSQASKFTVKSFIDGDVWLPTTNVVFDLTL